MLSSHLRLCLLFLWILMFIMNPMHELSLVCVLYEYPRQPPSAVLLLPLMLHHVTYEWMPACCTVQALHHLSASTFLFTHFEDDSSAVFAIVERRVGETRSVWWNWEKNSVSKWDSIILNPASQRGLFATRWICEADRADLQTAHVSK